MWGRPGLAPPSRRAPSDREEGSEGPPPAEYKYNRGESASTQFGNALQSGAEEKMLSLQLTLLHLFLLIVSTGWVDGATLETEVAAESSELSPWATADRAPTSMQGAVMGRSVWLPPLDHPVAPRAAERRWKRAVTHRDGFNRRAAKPRTLKPKPRETLGDRRRRVSFPMDKIGRSYLPKIKR